MPTDDAHVLDPVQPATVRLLVSVADAGSLSAGARAIGMAQSNASRSIAGLERRLGYPLLTRSTSGSTLTPEGALTVEWAREVLDAVDRFAAGAAALAAAPDPELVVGASMTIAEYLIPDWISAFRTAHPATRTTLRIDNSQHVIEAVRSGDVAIGFIETPDVPADVDTAVIGRDRLVVAVANDHPWLDRRAPLTLAELAATPLVEREPGSGTRASLDAATRSATGAERARPIAELNSNSAICHSVIAGLGPAVLSRLAVQAPFRAGRLSIVPVAHHDLGRELRAVWRRGHAPAGAAARLLEIAAAAGDR